MPKRGVKKSEDAIAMLKADHRKVKALFDEFEDTSASTKQQQIAAEALMELKIHATIEEEFFYPAVRQQIEDEDGIMEEADEEHHVAKLLIAELEQMQGDEDHWEAKFKVLAESVRHHIKEEEGEMFPQAKKTDIDFNVLGERMMELKSQLQADGVPPDAEAQMIKKSGLRGDSPARKAQEKLEVPMKAA
jgi:hemerythrin superfamily protein